MRVVRRVVHALLLVLMLLVGATAVVVIVSQTSWFRNWLRGYIVREAGQYLNGTVSIDRLGGNLFYGLEMENVGISMDGTQVVAVKDLGLDYSLYELISKGLSVDKIRLNKPVIYLWREGDTWSLSRLIKKQEQEANRQGPARPVSINQINVTDGSLIVDGAVSPVGTSGTVGMPGVEVPKRFEHVDANFAFQYSPVRYTVDITQISFRASDPDIALNTLSGGVSVRDDTVYVDKIALRTAESSLSLDGAVQQYLTTPVVNMQITSDKLSLPELARLVPALAGIRLQPAFELKLDGPLDHLKVDLDARSSAGQVKGTVLADVKLPQQSAAGTVSVRDLDLAPILNDPKQKTDITGEAKLDLRAASFSDINSLHGTVSLDAPRIVAAGYSANQVKGKVRIDGRRLNIDGQAAAYGASGTAAGSVALPTNKNGAVAFDLHGQARHVDLSRLPRNLNVPAAATNVNGEYHVTVSNANVGSRINGDLRFAPSTIAGATVETGSTLAFTKNGPEITYQTDATIADLDLQRVGEEFRVSALAADRYKSSINGHVVASGRAATPARIDDMEVTASGTLHDTSIMGGRIPQMAFDAGIQQNTAHVKATGSFAGFDPAVASGKPAMKGIVGGTIDVDGTFSNIADGVTPDTVEGTARINLEPSNVGGLDITSARIDGDYRRSIADLRTFDIVGRDLNVRATGTVALDEMSQSNLNVHADSPSLAQVGKLVDQPIGGIGQIDMTVAGNKRELQATGKFVGGGVHYGASEALSMTSDFTAKVSELDPRTASVSAVTHGTFVTIAGQNINDLTATTDYANQQMTFDATAKQPQRTMAAAGSLILHPDHDEVHLERLSLATQGMTWQTVPGSTATIQYANNAVKVENFKLVNADQQITADGAYGHAGDSLNVTATNVDVAMIDALMLRPPQLSGRLNATAAVTSDATPGSTPQVKGDFTIEKGGFQKFQYDSFGGTVNYTGRAVTLDTKLRQNPTTGLDVKGRVPTALFTSAAWSSSEPIDLSVDSTPIDAGLVQGFTTSLTNVTGTLEAHVHVTGSASDPQPNGTITVQNAAFTFVPNGVPYTQLDGKIDLQPDRVHIDQIRILDNQQKPLTLTGDLAIHEFQVGGLSIAVNAADFKVIDNEMGNVRINSDLRLTGQLTAPRLEGNLGITTGAINLDPILNLVGTSAYSTQEIEYLTPAAAPVATPPAPQIQRPAPSLPGMAAIVEAMQVDVRMTVPDDLVIKANDLRALDSPISLGALNVTLGGNLYVGRTPYDQTRIWGTVNTIRGTYNFQGRQFTILRDGTIRFEGLDQLDPELNIRTERVIQAVTANVTVAGSLRQPEIVLSSVPPLEQADVLSLILFNQPINQLGTGQQISLAQRAQSLAVGAVASELSSSIGSALGLNIFEISAAPESGNAALLTIGQQVGQDLFVKVQQGIGDQNQSNFILEYELATWLRLQANVIEGSSTQQQLFQRMQGSGVDLLFFFSY